MFGVCIMLYAHKPDEGSIRDLEALMRLGTLAIVEISSRDHASQPPAGSLS